MTLAELLRLSPTESVYGSVAIVRALSQKEEWRCYTSTLYWGTDQLIERFLRSHARIPGITTPEILGELPMAVFYWRTDHGDMVKGGTFLNGAVLVSRQADGSQINSLFVADETAKQWGYPDRFINLPRYVKQ